MFAYLSIKTRASQYNTKVSLTYPREIKSKL